MEFHWNCSLTSWALPLGVYRNLLPFGTTYNLHVLCFQLWIVVPNG